MKILLVSLVATACGTKAFADSDCGDSSKGKFTCDTDQISLEYTEKEIKQNGWYNINAGNGILVYGPYLDINPGVGKFKEKSVHASIPVSAEGGRGAYPCNAGNVNAGMLLYTVELAALNVHGRKVILDSKNVYRTWSGNIGTPPNYYGFPEGCVFGISVPHDNLDDTSSPAYEWGLITGTKYINLSSSRVPSTYNNFQIIVKNVHNSVRDKWDGFKPLNTSIYSFYTHKNEDQPIFLNINGFR